jgi:uncharacterized membrane protein YphA (DoxX/SURF4 family)
MNDKFRRIAFTVFSVLLGLLFMQIGSEKLLGGRVEQFVYYGYPNWFRILTGVIELSGGLLVIVPRTRLVGAAMIFATMTGALLTHLRVGDPAVASAGAIVFLVCSSIVLAGEIRRRRSSVACATPREAVAQL